ncbi:cytochrome c oxidase subunit 4 [Streptomyces ochraceiscleroticus]|uniref:cytochrome-c oxidase n=1 Tax=Streptomyces ochraceiscleroticus TaxID=47761 RepID=A0ABW1MNK0_9ACTN|nr:cytochrome c oxidase subunit 4 [Streptomyces ochraceiscleroticus]
MKAEAYLFGGVAAFFFVVDVVYALASLEPAGVAALTVSCLMAAVVSFFCAMNHRRKGDRPEDDRQGEVRQRAGRLDFFPPKSGYPPLTALGAAVAGLGIVFGLWLFVIGFGVLVAGAFGMVFEFNDR